MDYTTKAKELRVIFKKRLHDKLEEAVDLIKQMIIDKYSEELIDVVTDPDSKTNPNLYLDEFIDRLDEFEYIEKTSNSFSLLVPDGETFDFSGRLKVLETIINGVSGTYVEVNEDDYVAIFNKRPVNEDPLDEYVPPSERIYLVRYLNNVRKTEQRLNKKFVRYPFSNSPPIKILEVADEFVKDNIDEWIDESREEAMNEFVKINKGVKI